MSEAIIDRLYQVEEAELGHPALPCGIHVEIEARGLGDEPDALVVYRDDREIGAYCIVEDPEGEAADLRAMLAEVAEAARGRWCACGDEITDTECWVCRSLDDEEEESQS